MGCASPVSHTGSAQRRIGIESGWSMRCLTARSIVLSGLGHLFAARVYI